MTQVYIEKLELISQSINIGTQKIDGLFLEIYEIVIAEFMIYDKLGRAQFFEEIFLLTDISMKIVSEMLFLSFS